MSSLAEIRFDDQVFDCADSASPLLSRARAVECVFRACSFAEASFRGAHFTDCTFSNCDLSLVDLTDCLLHRTVFERCRLTGIDFGSLRIDALGVSVTFDECDLSLASFRDLDLRGSAWYSCKAEEVEFTGCDLRGVEMRGTDFRMARFAGNDLRESDLRGAENYLISTSDNRLKGMKADLPGALGLLTSLGIEVG